ncbi:MAG: FtsX-like permease family protein [Cellulosilyticaceae bacterium]
MGIKYLCLNTLRTFWKKKLQMFAIGIIVFLCSFLYTTMFYTMESLRIGVENLVEVTNQEDFSIEVINGLLPDELRYIPKDKQMLYSTYTLTELKKVDYTLYEGILKSRQKAFEKVYPNYNLEVREYKDIDFHHEGESHKIRIYKPAETINLTYMEHGTMPQGSNDIAINSVYTKANKLSLGDTVIIDEKDYRLTGNILLSDMNFPMLGNDFIIDNTKITIGVVTPRTYEKLKGDEQFYLAGTSKTPISSKDFKAQVIDDVKDQEKLKFITAVVHTQNQMRSGAIYEELKMGKAATLGICILISSLAVMIVGILISKLLKSEKVQIGVLKALGYTSKEIATPYVFLLLLLSVPMLVLGYMGGVMAAAPLKNFYLAFYLLPNAPIQTDMSVILVAILVPLFFILGLSFMMINLMLKKRTINLLKVGEKEVMPKLGKVVAKVLSGAKAQTKFKYTFIFKNTSKFVLFFWGIIFSSMMILISFMMSDFFDKMTIDHYEQTAYVWEGILDPSKPKPRLKNSDEPSLTIGNGFYEGEVISMKGIKPYNELYKLYNKKGVEITPKLQEGVIANQSFAIMYEVGIGDQVTIQLGDKTYEKEIVGVSKDYGDDTLYFDIEDLSRVATNGKSKKLYNGIYSTESLDKNMYLTTMNKYDLMSQAEMMQGFVKLAMGGMMSSAIFISVLILYVLTTMTVEDNYYNISLLKVMGYSEKEVNNMILSSYLVYAMMTYILSVPMTYGISQWMIRYFSDEFGIVMPLEMYGSHVILGFVVVVVIFFMGTYAAKRHISKVSLQEVLKAYRE